MRIFWKRAGKAGSVLAALSLGTSGLAQEQTGPMVSGHDPDGVLKIVQGAGYAATMSGDDSSRREITVGLPGGDAGIIFSDCSGGAGSECDTLVLSVTYDRNLPMSDTQVANANRNLRYVSVWKDGAGDPHVQWPILTRKVGIPAEVFLSALLRFSGVADDFGAIAFEGDVPPEADGN